MRAHNFQADASGNCIMCHMPEDFWHPEPARSSDPETSHEAARSLRRVSELQAVIVRALRHYGPMSDENLCEAVSMSSDLHATDQSIRSRRAELVRMGQVMDSGQRGTTRHGRKTILWVAA